MSPVWNGDEVEESTPTNGKRGRRTQRRQALADAQETRVEAPLPQPGEEPDPQSGYLVERETQAEALLRLASVTEPSRTRDGKVYARVPVGDHLETHEIRSAGFRHWMVHQFYKEKACPPSSDALQGVLGVLEARGRFDGPVVTVHVRVALGDGGFIYLDRADDSWGAVRITPGGWELVDQPPVCFRRPSGLLPLPYPVSGGSIKDFLRFVNVPQDDFLLLVAWITAALQPSGPYPVLVLTGEQGSAKSTLARFIRCLIDPHVSPLRSEPRDVRDLMISATNGWVLAFDNLSIVRAALSDALCRLVTGGAFATRLLYSDTEEVFLDAQRPVIATAIEDVVGRGDLADRSVFLHLPTIPQDRRKTEAEFWAEFEVSRGLLFGALLDAVALGLRLRPEVKLPRLPRMADFAVWGEAVCRAIGEKPGAFLAVYERNRRDANMATLEDAPLSAALWTLVEPATEWKGTASKLLGELRSLHPDPRALKTWLGSPRVLSGELRRLAPALRESGLDVEFTRGKHRLISLTVKSRETQSPPTPSSSEANNRDQPAPVDDGRATNCVGPDPQPSQTDPLNYRPGDGADAGDGELPSPTGDFDPWDEEGEWTA